jgi:hypothetical protein
MSKYLKYFAYGLFAVVLFAFALIMHAAVLMCLWNWFVIPLGFPKISLLHSMGITILFDFLFYHYYDFKIESNSVTAIKYILIRPAVAFVAGALVYFLQYYLR